MTNYQAEPETKNLLLRRVNQHIREHDWFAVLIDLIVVVVGVFLGLQAANWNEARLAKTEESILLTRYVSDLHAIEFEANAKAEFIGGNQQRIEQVLALLENNPTEPAGNVLQNSIERLTTMPGTIERSPTYLELLAGGMRRISDHELREAIVDHDGMLVDAKEIQAIRRNSIEPYVATLQRLRLLLNEVGAEKAIELSGGTLEIKLALLRLDETYNDEKARMQQVQTTTQELLALLPGER